MLQAQEVLGAVQRVGERAVGFVEEGGEGFGALFGESRGVFVWVGLVLEGEEFGAEGAQGDREGGVWGWAVGEGLREEGVVAC